MPPGAGAGPWIAGAEPVSGYQLVRSLGKGSFGEVWQAVGPGGFPVALKFVRLAGKVSVAEQRALELMKTLRHPNLLALHGTWQQGEWLILAMELADGTLLDRLRQATNEQSLPGIPLAELLRQMRSAAEGLDYLNAQGVQHRDVKPHNLLLVGGGVKVGDFGLVKLLQDTLASASGSMTPAYASPEACSDQVSRWSDQYSLAVTYCQLRGNRLPFEGPLAAVVAGHLLRAPGLEMVPRVEEREVVARALAKNPEQRWPSCTAFVAALAPFCAALPEPPAVAGPPDAGTTARDSATPASPLPSLIGGRASTAERGWTLVVESAPGPVTPPPEPPVSAAPVVPVPGTGRRKDSGQKGRSRSRVVLLAFGGGVLAAALLLLLFQGFGPSERPTKVVEVAANPANEAKKEDKKAPVQVVKDIPKEAKKDPVQPVKEIKKEDKQPPPVKEIKKEEKKEEKNPPLVLEKEITNSINMELVLIPAGEFMMGSPENEVGRFANEHAHKVKITKAFYLGKYEVNVGQFAAFAKASSYQTEGEKARHPNTWSNPGFRHSDRSPVVWVSWNDAVTFCKWLSKEEGKTYRLPTEAEWEYSCRAGTTTCYHSGDDEDSLKKVATYARQDLKVPVPNAWGLCDMHGNVWEWCQDWYDENYYKNCPPVDPQGPTFGVYRVFRGGSFFNGPTHCRSAYRDCFAPWRRTNAIGFRVVYAP